MHFNAMMLFAAQTLIIAINVYHLKFLSDFAISAPPQRAASGGRSGQSFRFSFEHEAMYEQKLQLSNHRRRRRRHHHYTTVFCIYWILTTADGVLLSPPPHTHYNMTAARIVGDRQNLWEMGAMSNWCWCYWQRRWRWEWWWCYGWYLALYIVVWIHHHIHQIEPNHTSIHSFVEPLGLIGITYFHSIAALIWHTAHVIHQ